MKKMDVRVRFAPSPTGYLHIGGLRTALYNYLFAKHNNGKLILRIEDTDRTRFVENAQENLIENLKWAGIHFDEGPGFGGEFGPYIQSERLHIYREYVSKLIENGSAYYAFDTAEELDEMRKKQRTPGTAPIYDRMLMRNQFTLGETETKHLLASKADFVIRLKIPHEQTIVFNDIIRGEISVAGYDVDDQVLLKSDGFPTYHLANVVDDYLMRITHVIRGEEWLPSVPKHVVLYQSFGWVVPQFAHLPLLLNKDKTKLSKRHGDVSVEDFRKNGYFKDAFVNFIALLGWNPSAVQEIYTVQELIDAFEITKVNKTGAVFDIQKLEWFNAQYFKTLPSEELLPQFKEILTKYEFQPVTDEYLLKVINLFKERFHFIEDIPRQASYMFEKPNEYDEDYIQKKWTENSTELSNELLSVYKKTEDFSHINLSQLTKQWCETKGIKLGVIIHPLRIMLTGKSTGAGMFETMEILGKQECLERMELFLANNS